MQNIYAVCTGVGSPWCPSQFVHARMLIKRWCNILYYHIIDIILCRINADFRICKQSESRLKLTKMQRLDALRDESWWILTQDPLHARSFGHKAGTLPDLQCIALLVLQRQRLRGTWNVWQRPMNACVGASADTVDTCWYIVMKTIEKHQRWCRNLKNKIPGIVQLRCEEKRSCRTSQPPSRRNSALFKTGLNTICASQKVTRHRTFPMAPKILQFYKYSCPGEVTTLTSATVILKARQIKEWKSQVEFWLLRHS